MCIEWSGGTAYNQCTAIFPVKKVVNRLRFDRIIYGHKFVSPLFAPPCMSLCKVEMYCTTAYTVRQCVREGRFDRAPAD